MFRHFQKRYLYLFLSFAILFLQLGQSFIRVQAQDTCGIDWYDRSSDPWQFVRNTRGPINEDPCRSAVQLSCGPFQVYAGDVNTGALWCADTYVPPAPPNYPGINAGASCLAGTSRIVRITPTGDEHRLQRAPSNEIVNLAGNSHTYSDMLEGVDYRFRAEASNAGGSSGWSDWTGIVRHDLSAPVTTLDLVALAGNNGWWRSNVSATLPATDTGCLGVASTLYTLDSVSNTYNATPIIISGDGSHSLSYYSSDGVHEEVAQNATIQIDTNVPSLQIFPDRLPDGNNGWWRGAVTFTVSGNDATSGVASVEYDLDGTGWQAFTSAITISADGTHTFDGRVVDVAGWETINGLNVPIDASRPNLQFVAERAPDRNGWYNHSVHVGVTYNDGTSGVAASIARLNAGNWAAYQGAYLIGGDGEHVFEAAVTDNAGNMTARQTVVKVDITAPVTTLLYDGSAIDFTITDNRSGVLGTTLSINGLVTAYAGQAIPLGEAGEYVIEFYSTDMAGNSEATQILRVQHDPNAVNVAPISGTAPVLQAELSCAAPAYQMSGFASASGGLSEVYLIAKPENGSELILRGDSSYRYNPASTGVEAIAFNYQAQTDAKHSFTLVALDANGNERRLTLTCPTIALAMPVTGDATDSDDAMENSDTGNSGSANPDEMSDSNPNGSEETSNGATQNQNPESSVTTEDSNDSAETSNYIPYNPPTTEVDIVPATSMPLTYVDEGTDSGLGASEIAQILAALGLVTTTAAAVVLQQSETAKEKKEEQAEKFTEEKAAVANAFAEQIQNAQANAQMNAELQAEKDIEVILAVEQSEANKAYHAQIAALIADAQARAQLGQLYKAVDQIAAQVNPMIEGINGAVDSLGNFMTDAEREELASQIEAFQAAQAADNPEAMLAQAQTLGELYAPILSNAQERYENWQEQQLAEQNGGGGIPGAEGESIAPEEIPYAEGQFPIGNLISPILGITRSVTNIFTDEDLPTDSAAINEEINGWSVIQNYKAAGWANVLSEDYGITLNYDGSAVTSFNGSQGWNLQSVYYVNQAASATATSLGNLYEAGGSLPEGLVLNDSATAQVLLNELKLDPDRADEVAAAAEARNETVFKETMGPVLINFSSQPNAFEPGHALTTQDNVITVYGGASNAGNLMSSNLLQFAITHEFGHVFDNYNGNFGSENLAASGIIANGQALSYRDPATGEWIRRDTNSEENASISDGMPPVDDSGIFEQHPVDNPNDNWLITGGSTPEEEFADMFAYWVYGGFDDSSAGQLRQQSMNEWLLGGMIYGDLLHNNADAAQVNELVNWATINGNELLITAGLDIAGQIARDIEVNDENPFNLLTHPTDVNENEHINLYEAALFNAYGMSFQVGIDGTTDDNQGIIALNYEALWNYHQGADLMAELYERVLTDTYAPVDEQGNPIDIDRYDLYHEIMGDMTIIRTETRSAVPNAPSHGYGYAYGSSIYDIFDQGRQVQMIIPNFVHELGHSLQSFSGMGSWPRSPLTTSTISTDANLDMAQLSGLDINQEYYKNLGIIDGNGDGIFLLRQNPSTDANEVAGDLILMMAYDVQGVIADGTFISMYEEYQAALGAAIRQTLMYRSTPEAVANYMSQITGIEITPASPINTAEGSIPIDGRFSIDESTGNVVNTPAYGQIPKSVEVVPLAQFTDAGQNTYVYVSYQTDGGEYIYAWIPKSTNFFSSTEPLDNLPALNQEQFVNLDPLRAINGNDPIPYDFGGSE